MQKDPRTHKIIGAAMEVHNEMGPGHLEAVYQECLEIEFELRGIPFISKPNLSLYYKKRKLKKFYVPDFIVLGDIVLEIKAQKMLTKDDEAQIINSLKSSRHEIGLLINYCAIEMELAFICYGPEVRLHSKLGLNLDDKIPEKQFKLVPDTS